MQLYRAFVPFILFNAWLVKTRWDSLSQGVLKNIS